MLCVPVPTAFVVVQLLQWMLPRLSALVAQPMKIVLGSKPDPPSWGSQFGLPGRADGSAVVDVEVGMVGEVVGAVVDEEAPCVAVGVGVETDGLEEPAAVV
jgi:hypothetical protein